jgi:RNA polymerase sigma-B factor
MQATPGVCVEQSAAGSAVLEGPGADAPASETHAGDDGDQRARETRRLLERYHRLDDRRARDEVIVRHLPLARHLARRFYRGSESLEDLVQVACVGLVKAVDRFDVERSTRFASYAVPTILGELRRYFRDHGWALHLQRGLQERVLLVERASDRLRMAHGRSPRADEVAQELGLSVEDTIEAMTAARATDQVSLDAPVSTVDGESDPLGAAIGGEDERFELIDDWLSISAMLGILPPRERRILWLRFGCDWTQSEIAHEIGVSQMQVSRLLRRSLERLGTIAQGAPGAAGATQATGGGEPSRLAGSAGSHPHTAQA